MAERRMFAKTIVTSDAFLDMPLSARCLYFTLGMFADDDGFVNSPKSIMRQVGATLDDMRILIAKKFIIEFEDGVIVIKHWRINNFLRRDRHIETKYKDHAAELTVDENGAYSQGGDGVPLVDQWLTNGIPSDNQRYTEDRLGKDRLGYISPPIVPPTGETPPSSKRFSPPSVEEVAEYCRERNNGVNAEQFVDFYSSKGWKVGSNPMKDWKAAVRTWEQRDGSRGRSAKHDNIPPTYDPAEFFDRAVKKSYGGGKDG